MQNCKKLQAAADAVTSEIAESYNCTAALLGLVSPGAATDGVTTIFSSKKN